MSKKQMFDNSILVSAGDKVEITTKAGHKMVKIITRGHKLNFNSTEVTKVKVNNRIKWKV